MTSGLLHYASSNDLFQGYSLDMYLLYPSPGTVGSTCVVLRLLGGVNTPSDLPSVPAFAVTPWASSLPGMLAVNSPTNHETQTKLVQQASVEGNWSLLNPPRLC